MDDLAQRGSSPENHHTLALETAVLVHGRLPLLHPLNPRFLNNRQQTYAALRAGGQTALLLFVAQQIRQFQQRGEEFSMQ